MELRQHLPGMLGRLVAVAVAMALAVHLLGDRIAATAAPLIKAWLQLLESSAEVLSLSVESRGAVGGRDAVFSLLVAPPAVSVINGQVAFGNPAGSARVTANVAQMWQTAVVALPLLACWPVRRWQEYLWRLLPAGAILLLLAAVDVPLVLSAQVWQLYVDAFDPGRFSPLLGWSSFLQGGGRFALAVLVATLATRLGQTRAERTARG